MGNTIVDIIFIILRIFFIVAAVIVIYLYWPLLEQINKQADTMLKNLPKYILKLFTVKDSAKKILLLIYAITVLWLCIFHVPWRGGNIEHPTAAFCGYGPIWEAPHTIARIDFNVLLIELFATTVVSGVSFYLLSNNRK